MSDITKEASSGSAEVHGVFDVDATIPAGRPLIAIFRGTIRKEAFPTDHGCWVVVDPSRICPDGEQDIACVKGTRGEIIELLRESLKPVLSLV